MPSFLENLPSRLGMRCCKARVLCFTLQIFICTRDLHLVQTTMRHPGKRIELGCRGTLTATVPGQSLYKAPQTYLAQHPTAPPEEQVITTDPENVLLRVLKLNQKREGPKGKGDKGKAAEKSKRPATEAAEGAPVNKKQNLQAAAGDGEAGSSRGPKAEKFTLQELQGKTNKALMDLLKDKGQSTKGKKEDLVKRLMELQKREATAARPH